MGPYTSRGFCQSRRKRLSKSLIPVRQNDVLGNSLPLTVDIAEGRGGVLNLEPIPQCPVGDDEAYIQVLASAYPLVASDGQSTYLCVGDVLESGKKAIILSPVNASVLCASRLDIFPASPEDPCQLLHQLLVSLISEGVVSKSSGPI
jgi:hypothetical protein